MLRNLRLGLRIKRLQALLARRSAHVRADGDMLGDGPTRTRVLANLSHELRTPLSGILGMADLLLDTPLGPAQATYVRAIRTSSEALLSLVEEVLDLAKIDAGSIELRPAPVDLPDLVESVVELLAPRAQAKGLDLTARLTPGVPRIVVADGPRLRQILLNLAGNALKFTDRGGVGIRIERHGSDLRLAVIDTGIGIPAARLPTLFREFDRAGAGEGRDGAGLGLAITHRLVAAMGGAIDVDTAVGKGSSFTVTLPGVVPAEAEAPSAGQPLQGRRVLVAAPSPFEAPWLVEALGDAGAAASLSANLEDARLRIAAERPHAVLVDRAFGPRIAELVAPAAAASVEALLVMLAPAERSELPGLEAAGFTGWLVKPVRPRTLVARLAPDEVPQPTLAELVEAPAPAAERPLKVLVAEDDEVNALLARTLLARLGHRAERVADGDSATAAFAAAAGSDPFDLVLLDLRMPGTDGLAAARRLRDEEVRQGLEPAKILALSANAFEEDREAARAAGMDGFLAKPLTAKALNAAIEEMPVARAS